MKRRSAPTVELDQPFESLGLGRLTWLGLAIAALGWALILGETTVAAVMFAKTALAPPPGIHADLFAIGQCVVVSGFGLAIVGALQTGFGTLNRFFGAVLLRSGRRDAANVPVPAHTPQPAERTKAAPSVTIERRPYRQFPDGSVEVDTILGTRLFTTMAEARDFI